MLARVIAISDRQDIENIQLHNAVEQDFCLTEANEILQELFDNEFEFLDRIFESDSKNYHAWSHRIWLVERFELWGEPRHIEFVENMLDRDVSNNSAWSFRYFLVMRKSKDMFSKSIVNMELRYVTNTRLPQNYKNEAVWSYMRGFLASTKEEATNSQKTTAKRWFIKDFDWLTKTLNEYLVTAESSELDKFMEETSKVDDMIAETKKKYTGLRDNRFLYLTLADCAIAN